MIEAAITRNENIPCDNKKFLNIIKKKKEIFLIGNLFDKTYFKYFIFIT